MIEQLAVFCGARVLCDWLDAERWARGKIDLVLNRRPWTHVVHGGARGPDTWSGEAGAARGLIVVTYALDGCVYVNGVVTRRWTEQRRPYPLDRNLEIVRAMRLRNAAGAYVGFTGLKAAWSTTDGTGHAIRHAKDASLTTWTTTCPRELQTGTKGRD